MAMEMHVLSDRRLSSTTEWQRAIEAEKFPLRLEPNIQLASVNGFLPLDWIARRPDLNAFTMMQRIRQKSWAKPISIVPGNLRWDFVGAAAVRRNCRRHGWPRSLMRRQREASCSIMKKAGHLRPIRHAVFYAI